jgi:hypothetical protein
VNITLNSVALRKAEQANALGDVALLDEAIAHFRAVLDLFPATAPMHTATLHNLANALSDRFHLTADLGNLRLGCSPGARPVSGCLAGSNSTAPSSTASSSKAFWILERVAGRDLDPEAAD